MSRLKITCIILVLSLVGIVLFAYKKLCVVQPIDTVVNEYAFLNDSYSEIEKKLSEDNNTYKQITFQQCQILTLEYKVPLYIIRGNQNGIYSKKESTQIQIKEDVYKICLKTSPIKDKYDAVFMFMSELPDTIIITNKGYFQDLYLVNFNKNANTPVLVANEATAVLNSDISKLNIFINNGIFSFYEYCQVNDDIDKSELQLKVSMIDSHFFFNTFLSDSVAVDIESKNCWFDISVKSDYIENFNITGDIRTVIEGEKNSMISLVPKRDILICDRLNIEIENEEYLDLVFSDSVIIKNSNILNEKLNDNTRRR